MGEPQPSRCREERPRGRPVWLEGALTSPALSSVVRPRVPSPPNPDRGGNFRFSAPGRNSQPGTRAPSRPPAQQHQPCRSLGSGEPRNLGSHGSEVWTEVAGIRGNRARGWLPRAPQRRPLSRRPGKSRGERRQPLRCVSEATAGHAGRSPRAPWVSEKQGPRVLRQAAPPSHLSPATRAGVIATLPSTTALGLRPVAPTRGDPKSRRGRVPSGRTRGPHGGRGYRAASSGALERRGTCRRVRGGPGCGAEGTWISGRPEDPQIPWQRSRTTWPAGGTGWRRCRWDARLERVRTGAGRKTDPGAGTETSLRRGWRGRRLATCTHLGLGP